METELTRVLALLILVCFIFTVKGWYNHNTRSTQSGNENLNRENHNNSIGLTFLLVCLIAILIYYLI